MCVCAHCNTRGTIYGLLQLVRDDWGPIVLVVDGGGKLKRRVIYLHHRGPPERYRGDRKGLLAKKIEWFEQGRGYLYLDGGALALETRCLKARDTAVVCPATRRPSAPNP